MGLYKGSNEVAGYQVVDGELSDKSENPVQNKVITSALDSKADTSALDGKADESIISDAYDSTKTYVGGDMFISDNVLYKVKDSITSVVGQVPPNANYYEVTNINNLLSNVIKLPDFANKINQHSTSPTFEYTAPFDCSACINIKREDNGSATDCAIYVNNIQLSTYYARNQYDRFAYNIIINKGDVIKITTGNLNYSKNVLAIPFK